ncbi:MAG: hypothetical protein K8W52_15715 [Deltaproteobacteria bacterium]|nr:hypothetical protein [Deltaproteobacteria bacterium]
MIDRTTRLALACATLLATHAATARAEEAEPDAGGDGAAADAPPEPPADGTAASEPAPPAPEAAASRWPRAVIARPLTLPKSLLQLGLDLAANHDFSNDTIRPSVGYGISDKLEAGVGYAYAIHPFEFKGNLDPYVGYAIVRGAVGGKLEIIARGTTGYNALSKTVNPLQLGVQVQYNVSSKLAIISNSLGATGGGGQLVIGVDAPEGVPKPIKLVLPVAVGYQATPELYLQLDTVLASIKIKDSANAFIGADSTPLSLSGVYNAIPALDVLAGLSCDPNAASFGDSLAFSIGARYYVGAL